MVHGPVRSGKSARLLALLDEHGEAIEADLAQTYGVDLLDYFRGRRPAGQIIRLIHALPPGSRLSAQLAATHPANSSDVPLWRRLWGWDVDRIIRHASVAIHLTGADREAWDAMRPQRWTGHTGSLADLAESMGG